MKPSKDSKKKFSRESIIGLGEDSFKKNYYPELQRKILELEKYNARSAAIINTIPDMLLIGDEEGHIQRLAGGGRKHEALMERIEGDEAIIKTLKEAILEVLQGRKTVTLKFEMTELDHRYLEARINATDYEEALMIIRDITEQTLYEEELIRFAERDSMTGLYNRRIFEKKMTTLNGRTDQGVGIIIMDIDGLKFINDTLGHQLGDEVIRIVSGMIEKHFCEAGLLARLSGDEFGIIGEAFNEMSISVMMDALQAEVDDYNERSERLNISLSYGYAQTEVGEVLDMSYLFSKADNNMYQNKMFKSSSVRSSIVKTLMKALEARDYITEGHADRMEALACDLGKKIGLTRSQIDKLKLLAKFHDIGKVGIPDRILNKPAKLDKEEYGIMKTHTQIGRRIAEESVDLREIADLIYHHHEQWDGNGYPKGLKGEEIPIECRILALVDTLDAMTNDRPYRKALSIKVSVEEIKKYKGIQFDPELTEIFLEYLYDSGKFQEALA